MGAFQEFVVVDGFLVVMEARSVKDEAELARQYHV
jgi:hypothetical protein